MRRLFIDTETGGLIAGEFSLLTVGLVAHDDDKGIIDTMHIEVKDRAPIPEGGLHAGLSVASLYRCHPKALETNKINLEEHDKVAVPMDVAARTIFNFVRKNINFDRPFGWKKPGVYGQNVLFDLKWFDYLFNTTGIEKPYTDYAPTDTLLITAFLQDAGVIPTTKDKKLSTLLTTFGIEVDPNSLHNALTDTLATRELWLALRQVAREKLSRY